MGRCRCFAPPLPPSTSSIFFWRRFPTQKNAEQKTAALVGATRTEPATQHACLPLSHVSKSDAGQLWRHAGQLTQDAKQLSQHAGQFSQPPFPPVPRQTHVFGPLGGSDLCDDEQSISARFRVRDRCDNAAPASRLPSGKVHQPAHEVYRTEEIRPHYIGDAKTWEPDFGYFVMRRAPLARSPTSQKSNQAGSVCFCAMSSSLESSDAKLTTLFLINECREGKKLKQFSMPRDAPRCSSRTGSDNTPRFLPVPPVESSRTGKQGRLSSSLHPTPPNPSWFGLQPPAPSP